jgi:hypothetical protein
MISSPNIKLRSQPSLDGPGVPSIVRGNSGLSTLETGRCCLRKIPTAKYQCLILAGLLAVLFARDGRTEAAAGNSDLGYSRSYQGNPNPSISEIAPAITCSRSGPLLTPAFIQCSASATTAGCSGSLQCRDSKETNPYEDLEYAWDFGDSKGAETFVNPLSGATVNANDHQWGPEATYVYRAAGTYKITLTARGCRNGASNEGRCSGEVFTTATATTSISIVEFNPVGGEYWFAASGNDNGFCTRLAPCRTISKLNTLIMRLSNLRFHLNCGDSFSSSTGINLKSRLLSNSGIRIDAAGPSCPGSCPIVDVSKGSNFPLNIQQSGSGRQSDIVVSRICFTNSNSATNTATVGLGIDDRTTGSIGDVYFDHVTNIDSLGRSGLNGYNIQPARGATLRNIAVWGGTVSAPLTGANCTGILGGSQQWYSIVGVMVSGNGNVDPIRCHHIYIHGQQHVLARWNIGGKSDPSGNSPTRNYTIKTSYDNTEDGIAPGGFYAGYFLVSENHLYGTTFGRNISNWYNDPLATRFRFYVDQQNLYDNLPGKGDTGIIQPWTAETFTERDSRACNSGDIWFTPNGTRKLVYGSAQIYRNQIYNQSNAGFIVFNSVNWGDGSPLKQIVTDNTFYSTNSAANLNDFAFSDWNSSGSVVDRNHYYAPHASANYLFNDRSGISFSKWQAQGWDVHGSAGIDPAWPKPENCDFGTWPYN